jgi:hypothetical protein
MNLRVNKRMGIFDYMSTLSVSKEEPCSTGLDDFLERYLL